MGISLQEVRKSFGVPPTLVLKGVSLSVNDGEFVAITGRSGSGKSTLLYIMSGLDVASSGRIDIDEREVSRMDEEELHRFRNLKMGFVFQFHHLLPELTALENVLMPAIKRGITPVLREEAQSLLAEFGLGGKFDRLPGQLSGGEQQRVAIARALAMRPKYLFADEPTGNLDSVNGMAVMKLYQRINAERGTTIVFVTHDPGFASMARRRIEMVDGLVASDSVTQA